VDPNAPLPPHLDPRGRHRGRRSAGGAGRRSLVRVTLAFFTVVSVGSLCIAGYAWMTYRNINKGVHRLNVSGLGSAPASNKVTYSGKEQNILLVGNDDRSNMTTAEVNRLHVGRGSGSDATDTMMIVHVPANGARATLISLPRDTYVNIPGYGMDKLNAAYVDGYGHATGTSDQRRAAGASLLIKTISNLTGLSIDHYVQVSLMGFYDISNAIGGVTVDLCDNVDDTVAHNRAIGSDGGSGLVMSKGKHVIKGVKALEFVRQRHGLPRGDLDRVRRQQYFLTAAFRKVASVGVLFKLKELGDAVKRNVYMDPGLDLIGLAHQMENLSANNIIGKTIPTTPETIDGSDVLVVNTSRIHRFIDNIVNPPSASSSASAQPGSTPAGTSGASTAPTSSASSKPIDAKCIN